MTALDLESLGKTVGWFALLGGVMFEVGRVLVLEVYCLVRSLLRCVLDLVSPGWDEEESGRAFKRD